MIWPIYVFLPQKLPVSIWFRQTYGFVKLQPTHPWKRVGEHLFFTWHSVVIKIFFTYSKFWMFSWMFCFVYTLFVTQIMTLNDENEFLSHPQNSESKFRLSEFRIFILTI